MSAKKEIFTGIIEWLKDNKFWLLAHVLNILAGLLIFFTMKDESSFPILTVVIFMSLIFIHLFTSPIKSLALEGSTQNEKSIEEERSRQRNKWMIFAYSFMLLSLILVFYPFINPLYNLDEKPNTSNNSDDKVSKNYYLKSLRERPIAVFIGCTLSSNAKNLACRSYNDKKEQIDSKGAWVINIGGYIESCEGKNSESEASKKNNFGETVTCQVRDGLIVPLYFIIIALMGGSISLTRRLPELQKQAGSEHIPTETQPKLTQYEFREHLIFQMVQFISAPFLAVLAYFLIEPSDITHTVALAFIAGFASETILLMVRSVTNKITPETKSLTNFGAVAGTVKFGKNDPNLAGKPAENIEVSIAGLKTFTDAQGFYMLKNIPTGDHAIFFNNKTLGVETKEVVKIDRAQAITNTNVIVEKKT